MGDDLIGPTYGNPRGHYENRDFVDLQQSWIEANGFEFVLPVDAELKLSEADLNKAKNLIERHRSTNSVWGWKDPRSVLFLDTWRQLLPDCVVIIMLRPWRQVIHSLLRRDRRQEASAPKSWLVPLWHHPLNPLIIDKYVQTWICYNRHTLRFQRQHPDQTLILGAERLYSNREEISLKLEANSVSAPVEKLGGLFQSQDWEEDTRNLAVSPNVAAQADELESEFTKLLL